MMMTKMTNRGWVLIFLLACLATSIRSDEAVEVQADGETRPSSCDCTPGINDAVAKVTAECQMGRKHMETELSEKEAQVNDLSTSLKDLKRLMEKTVAELELKKKQEIADWELRYKVDMEAIQKEMNSSMEQTAKSVKEQAAEAEKTKIKELEDQKMKLTNEFEAIKVQALALQQKELAEKLDANLESQKKEHDSLLKKELESQEKEHEALLSEALKEQERKLKRDSERNISTLKMTHDKALKDAEKSKTKVEKDLKDRNRQLMKKFESSQRELADVQEKGNQYVNVELIATDLAVVAGFIADKLSPFVIIARDSLAHVTGDVWKKHGIPLLKKMMVFYTKHLKVFVERDLIPVLIRVFMFVRHVLKSSYEWMIDTLRSQSAMLLKHARNMPRDKQANVVPVLEYTKKNAKRIVDRSLKVLFFFFFLYVLRRLLFSSKKKKQKKKKAGKGGKAN